MVKTKAPLLSLGASGGVGGVLIASNWRGRSYMKKLTTPTNPNTPAQVGVRSMLKFLTEHWQTLTVGEAATWDKLAEQQAITPMDAYVQSGLKRWSTGKFPSQEYPPTEAGGVTQCTLSNPIAQGRGAIIPFDVPPFQLEATVVIFHSTLIAFTWHYTNAVHLRDSPADGHYTWLHTPLAPGWHYYLAAPFTRTGRMWGPTAGRQILIT